MKKNNKGVTLVELIVSFALVSIAVIYFYNTLNAVYKIYKESRKNINHYVDVEYKFKNIDYSYNMAVNSENDTLFIDTYNISIWYEIPSLNYFSDGVSTLNSINKKFDRLYFKYDGIDYNYINFNSKNAKVSS